MVIALIEESIAEFKGNGRLGTCLLPLQIRDVLNSLACHGKENSIYYFFSFQSFFSSIVGAIKFGDELSSTQCAQLVRALGQCDVPFQCAHGRPLLAPLIELSELIPLAITPESKPNYNRLSML